MKRITVAEASNQLGIPKQAVRCGLKKDKDGHQPLPIGFRTEGTERSSYYIFQEMLDDFMRRNK